MCKEKKTNSKDMKKYFIQLVIYAFICCLFACGGRSNRDKTNRSSNRKLSNETNKTTTDSYKIRNFKGNVIEATYNKRRCEIVLLGIENSHDVEKYLAEKYAKNAVLSIVRDSKGERERRGKIYAYVVDNEKKCLNSILLKDKISRFNDELVSDSLDVYKAYEKEKIVPEIKVYNNEELAEMVRPATFMIRTYDVLGNQLSQGSGFFVNELGLGVSNHHVIEGGHSWKVQTCSENESRTYEITSIVMENAEADYAVFKVGHQQTFSYLPIAKESPRQGQEIIVYGHPRGLECTLTTGTISAVRTDQRKNDEIQIEAPISPGSSGSPVVNQKGEVIGIATKKRTDNCESCNFAYNIKLIPFYE